MDKTLAIYIDGLGSVDTNILKAIRTFFRNDYDDFCIISDNNDGISSDYGMVLPIYAKFFRGDIVILDPLLFIKIKDDLIANQIFLYGTLSSLLDANISKKQLENIKILTLNNNTIDIEVIENVKLQQTI